MSQFETVPTPPKRGLSTGAKIGIGCAVTTVILIVLVCAGVFFGSRWVIGKLDEMAQEYVDQGYVRVSAQTLVVGDRITEPTVYTCQSLRINDGAETDIAILSQQTTLGGTYEGDVDFMGQTLIVERDAVIKGDLTLVGMGAQIVNIKGVVEGEVSGNAQQITRPKPPPAKAPVAADDGPD